MNNFPLVSIITPTYNDKNFIRTCIESVLRQRFDAWEQIIIDDGSTDGTDEIIKTYRDSRIRFIRQNHRGIWHLSEAYNAALKLARGDYIAILEGDDFWPADKLEKQIPYFDDDDTILTWGKGIIVDEMNRVIGEIVSKPSKGYDCTQQENPIGMVLNSLLIENFLCPAVTIIVRRSSLMEIGGFQQPPGVPFADYATWLELCLKGRFCFVNEILGYWRHHRLQTTNLFFAEMLWGHAEVSYRFYNRLLSKERRLYKLRNKSITSMNSYLRGRAFFVKKEYKKANQEYIRALLNGHFLIRCRAALGLLSSISHLDLGRIIRRVI